MPKITAGFLISGLFSAQAFALDTWVGHVTTVEASYMPTSIYMFMDTGSSSGICNPGTTLKWSNANLDNNKATLAVLIAATVSGKKIQVYINVGDTTCLLQNIHLLNN